MTAGLVYIGYVSSRRVPTGCETDLSDCIRATGAIHIQSDPSHLFIALRFISPDSSIIRVMHLHDGGVLHKSRTYCEKPALTVSRVKY